METGRNKSAFGRGAKAFAAKAFAPKVFAPRAFTLLELVVVMLIISVALAISAPSLRGFWGGQRSRNSAMQIVALTKWARTQSVSEGKVYRLNVTGTSYGLTMQEQENFVTVDSEMGQAFAAPDGVQIELKRGDGADGDHIDFFADGTSEAGSITLKEADGSTIEITSPSPTEGFRMTNPNDANGAAR